MKGSQMAISNRSLLKLPLALGGSISTANVRPVAETGRLHAIAQAEGLERDRQAILSMVGEYKVKFEFEEFEPADGYSARPPYRSGAFELVLLAEDAGNRIVLQHLLVHRRMGFVIKHWRQDWHYEAQKRLEFTQDQTWRVSAIDPAETKGAWTQSVIPERADGTMRTMPRPGHRGQGGDPCPGANIRSAAITMHLVSSISIASPRMGGSTSRTIAR
jgi:hypothetical protein